MPITKSPYCSECADQLYLYYQHLQCLPCKDECQKCSTYDTCTQCGLGADANYYYLNGTSCITDCPPGTYKNTSNFQCTSCHQ